MSNNLLVIITSLTGSLVDGDAVRLTDKFVEGTITYVDYWKGQVKVMVHPEPDAGGNLDSQDYKLSDLPFEVELVDFNDFDAIKRGIKGAAVVQGGSSHYLHGLAQFCLDNKIAYVHCSEYTLKTRCQIVSAHTTNPVLRLRRYFWEWNQERKNVKEVKLAAAAQCNGMPTFEQYRSLNTHAMVYFDNRINDEDLLAETDLKALPENVYPQQPIRLAFSGRLNKMKGADALIRIADILKRRSLPFELHIYGGGELEDQMRKDIQSLGLNDQVTMHGVLDFHRELLPELKEKIDLFVCCHVQGDPSCTYVETFACGVPIVGYTNEAFEGILKISLVGWGVPLFDDTGIADKIEAIIKNPDLLDPVRRKALKFAADNTFHKVFDARIKQMKEVMIK